MGWFLMKSIPYLEADFRPRLGMGWFVMSDEEIQLRDDFRPRLGMGWFYERI